MLPTTQTQLETVVLFATPPDLETASTLDPALEPGVAVTPVPTPWPDRESLARAIAQSWHWDDVAETVDAHAAHLRLTLPVPEGATPAERIDAFGTLLTATDSILALSGALAMYNPLGDLLLDKPRLWEIQLHSLQHELPALDAWSNVRFHDLGDDWMLADSVGQAQIGLPDVEIGFPRDALTPPQAARFVRELGLHLLDEGEAAFPAESTTEGPSPAGDTDAGEGEALERVEDVWEIHWPLGGVAVPPRRVLRLLPVGKSDQFQALIT